MYLQCWCGWSHVKLLPQMFYLPAHLALWPTLPIRLRLRNLVLHPVNQLRNLVLHHQSTSAVILTRLRLRLWSETVQGQQRSSLCKIWWISPKHPPPKKTATLKLSLNLSNAMSSLERTGGNHNSKRWEKEETLHCHRKSSAFRWAATFINCEEQSHKTMSITAISEEKRSWSRLEPMSVNLCAMHLNTQPNWSTLKWFYFKSGLTAGCEWCIYIYIYIAL